MLTESCRLVRGAKTSRGTNTFLSRAPNAVQQMLLIGCTGCARYSTGVWMYSASPDLVRGLENKGGTTKIFRPSSFMRDGGSFFRSRNRPERKAAHLPPRKNIQLYQ